jgi:acetyl esterase
MLQALSGLDTPPLEQMGLAEARASSEMMAGFFPAGPEMAEVRDETVPGPAGPIPIRVYRPAGDPPVGTVVYFHGGGFVVMGLDSHDGHCRHLAQASGAAVVSVDYRLAPEHPFPAPGEDCIAATEAVLDGAVSGAPSARVAVSGDSAGGNLSVVVALWARDQGRALALQVLGYPVTDFSTEHPSVEQNSEGYLLTAEAMRWFRDQYLPHQADWTDPRASVLLADLHDVAPALVITAEFDPLRDEDAALVDALRAAGVEVTHHHADGMIHGYLQMIGMIDAAAQAMELSGRAIRQAFSA